ncbi:uncharacterized protein [Epargyreus clarus]
MGNVAQSPAKAQTEAEIGHTSQDPPHGISYVAKNPKTERCRPYWKLCYITLSVVTIFLCIATIAVSVSTAIATKTFSVHQSERLVAMIILAVTAAMTLSMVIYAVMAVIRKQRRPLHVAAVVLFLIAIIQAIICVASVKLTAEDEASLFKALSDSFRTAKEENPRHVKLWSMTQSDLNCCGMYGSSDYRVPNLPLIFPPDVPISCCPTYDPDRSELVQERERESCKARREYYEVGCREPVLQLFRYSATLVLTVSIVLILLEILLAILSALRSRKLFKHKKGAVEQSTENTKG